MRPYFSILTLAVWPLSYSQTYNINHVAGGGLPGGTAATASTTVSPGMAADSAGNLYFPMSGQNVVMKLDANGALTRVAGDGTYGSRGDNGPATSAQLALPFGVALDSAGNLYIADSSNNRVRRVSNGVITTVAGNGAEGFSGDGGPAIDAMLNRPGAVAVSPAGDLYILDSNNNRIRKVANGIITTIAGNGSSNFSGDNGPATSAALRNPRGLAFNSQGQLFIADGGNHRVRMVSGGVITTVAGTGAAGYSGDGGPAANAQLNSPWGIAIDASGGLYVVDSGNVRIRKISNGVISTVAGNGTRGFSGDGGPAVAAELSPSGVAAGTGGDLLIADSGNYRIRRVRNGVISTIAGNGTSGFAGDFGPATTAQMNRPSGVAVDQSGNIYVADYLNRRVRKVSNGVITTIAGTGERGFSGDGGSALAATFDSPLDVAVDLIGNIYVVDYWNNRIRRISNGVISTVAGNGVAGYGGDNGPATGAQLNGPWGIAVGNDGSLYIADRGNHRIRKVANGTITTIAGDGESGYRGDGGLATAARFSSPHDVSVAPDGTVFVADFGNNRVRMISNGIISTLAGTGVYGYSGDNGPATSADFSRVLSVAVDPTGQVFVLDFHNYRIRRIANGTVSTVAGTGVLGYTGDGGPAANAEVGLLSRLESDTSGNIYVADESSNRIRVLQPAAATCSYAISASNLSTAASGGSVVLTVNTAAGCPWSLSGLPGWLSPAGAAQGSGPATVSLVADNNSGAPRSGVIAIGGVTIPVRQFDSAACGGAGSCVTRALPHLAYGGDWATSLSAVNSGAVPGSYALNFYNDRGESVALPVAGAGGQSTVAGTVPARGRNDLEVLDPILPVQGAWALVTAAPAVTVHAAFRRGSPGNPYYEAAVPASEGYSSFVIPFDATTFAPTGEPLYTGFAISNLNPLSGAKISCEARDHTGSPIPNAITIPTLNALGHYANYLFPALTGRRGSIACEADTLVAAIVLRFIGSGAFSTQPVITK